MIGAILIGLVLLFAGLGTGASAVAMGLVLFFGGISDTNTAKDTWKFTVLFFLSLACLLTAGGFFFAWRF